MEIKVKNIKLELTNLKKFIENYELTNLNIQNETTKASFNWNDGNSTKFFEDVESKKTKILTMIDEFKTTSDIYGTIVDKYKILGDTIKFNLDDKINVYNQLEDKIKEIDSIIKAYGNLDLSFCNHLTESINNQLEIMKDTKIKLTTYKKELMDIIEYIEETENEIKLKVSENNIEIEKEEIQEQKVEDFY